MLPCAICHSAKGLAAGRHTTDLFWMNCTCFQEELFLAEEKKHAVPSQKGKVTHGDIKCRSHPWSKEITRVRIVIKRAGAGMELGHSGRDRDTAH